MRWHNPETMTGGAPELDPDAKIHVAGHSGLVGGAIRRALEREGFTNVVGARSSEVDLRDREAVREYVATERPGVIIDAAARVGGIGANDSHPTDFISDNLRIQVNLMDAALEFGVERFLFLGSSCAYPRISPQPIPEEAILTGPLEPTNDAYAIAKLAGIIQVQSVRRQHGLPWISAMPTNVYGPGDNYDPDSSHVIAALIRRFVEAADSGAPSVTLWGTGAPRRDFIHCDDLAEACIALLRSWDDSPAINVGSGSDIPISEVAALIAEAAGFGGMLEWDSSKPDGTPRKLLDTTLVSGLGWSPRIGLAEGIASTIEAYRSSSAG